MLLPPWEQPRGRWGFLPGEAGTGSYPGWGLAPRPTVLQPPALHSCRGSRATDDPRWVLSIQLWLPMAAALK